MTESTIDSANPVTRQIDTGRLSTRGRMIALFFVASGLSTFALPMIQFDPAWHGQQYWSVLGITQQIQAALHLDSPVEVLFFIPFGMVYLSLLVALGTLLLIPFRKALGYVSVAGLFLLYPFRGFLGGIRLAAFLGSPHGGDLRTLWVVLGIVMFALVGVASTDART